MNEARLQYYGIQESNEKSLLRAEETKEIVTLSNVVYDLAQQKEPHYLRL